jgi:XTP/dITP diphosphohydrolase
MNQRIVLATGNTGKAKEFAEMLGGQFDIVLQTTLRLAAAEETGCTFLENALLKASDADNNAKLLVALENIPAEQRAARFRCVVVYVRSADDAEPLIAEGSWDGAIALAERGTGGFGYDPLFSDLSDGAAITAESIAAASTSAELLPAEKHARSHRGVAVRELCRRLQEQPA